MNENVFSLFAANNSGEQYYTGLLIGASLERCTALACNIFNSSNGAIYLKCVKISGSDYPTVFEMSRV